MNFCGGRPLDEKVARTNSRFEIRPDVVNTSISDLPYPLMKGPKDNMISVIQSSVQKRRVYLSIKSIGHELGIV